MLTKVASRKRAQVAFPKLPPCEKCGSTVNVQRHHADHQAALSVEFLCQPCHTIEDYRLGRWGRGKKKAKVCAECGKEFTNFTHSRVKLCSKACRSEAGRRNALKRWRTGSSELKESETP